MTPIPYRAARLGIIGGAALVFVGFCVLPVTYMLAVALFETQHRNGLAVLLLDARQRTLLANSIWLASGATIVATTIGVLTGLTLSRVRFRFKRLVRLALLAPLLVPPYVAALGWTYVARPSGSLPAAAAILGFAFFPIVMFATEGALGRVEPRLEEAALLVAPHSRVLWRITLPLIAPAVGAAALIVFVLGLSEFGVPALLGVRIFTTEVFTAFAALYDFNRAVTLAVPLLVLSMLVSIPVGAVTSRRLITTRRGYGGTHLQIPAAWRRPALALCVAVIGLALAVPILSLLREASNARSAALALEGSGLAVANSLLFSAAGASAATGLAIWLGYARARTGRTSGRLVDALCVALFAAPSTVVGIGLIRLWNRPGPMGMVYGTDLMLLLGYLARFLPIAVLLVAAIVAQVSVAQEEAAAVGGARWWKTMRRILLPQIRRPLGLVWVLLFVLVFGELGTSILVAPPGEATLPIRIYTLIANTPSANVAMLALMQTAVVLSPLAVLSMLNRPGRT